MPSLDPKLLADIIERPEDDASRLVLADALQEKSDPRGHFIVAQCRLAQRGLARDERSSLQRDVASLLKAHGAEWAGVAARLGAYTMRRGFVDEVSASAEDLVAVCAELFATQPITRLTLDDASADTLAPLAEDGAFQRVLRLTIHGSLEDDGARVLATALAKRKTPLASLNVGANGITASGAAALASALAGCRSLALTGNMVGDDGASAIAKAKPLSALQTLFLTENELSDEGVIALAKSTTLGSLVRLGLARNDDVTEDGLAQIARSKRLKRLRWLEYSDADQFQTIATRR